VTPAVLPAGNPYPAWDPMPRPPRRTASWIALTLVVAAGVIAAVGVGDLAGARYAARADVCSAVQLGPVGTALGRPDLTAVAANSPAAAERNAGPTELRCRFSVAEPEGERRAVGTVTAIWYDHALAGRFSFETRRAQAGGSIHQRDGLAELSGLGDAAFTYHDDEARFRAATLDSNLVLDLQVAVAPGDPAWTAADAGPPLAALTAALRASLPRLQ
jgi:hypothetical protein